MTEATTTEGFIHSLWSYPEYNYTHSELRLLKQETACISVWKSLHMTPSLQLSKYPLGNVHTYSCTSINTHINFAFIHIISPGKYVRGTSQGSGNRQALLIDTALPHRVWSNRGSVKKTDQMKQTAEAQNCDIERNIEFL